MWPPRNSSVSLRIIWASPYKKGTYHIGKQQRLRRASAASAQPHRSHCSSHTQYILYTCNHALKRRFTTSLDLLTVWRIPRRIKLRSPFLWHGTLFACFLFQEYRNKLQHHKLSEVIPLVYAPFWHCFDIEGYIYLNLICLVDFSNLINWTSPFPILGVSGVIFHFYFIFDRNSCKQTV